MHHQHAHPITYMHIYLPGDALATLALIFLVMHLLMPVYVAKVWNRRK